MILSGAFLSKAQTKNPDRDQLLGYYENQRYIEAAAYLQSFYKEDPKDIKSLNQLAYANLMANQLPEAEKFYLKINDLQPKTTPVLFSLAAISTKRGNTAKAKVYYQDILALDSTNFHAYKALAGLSKGDERLSYLKKANLLQPLDADVAVDLSETYYTLKLFGPSSEILETALKADTSNFRLLKIKIPLSLALKKYNDAIQTGQKLLHSGDSSAFVLNNLGESYFFLSDFKNALKCFLKANDQTADQENLVYHIALSYRGLRDYKNAILYLNKSITAGVSPKTASYYGLLGESYEGTGQNNEAIAAYKRGLLFENNGSLYYNLALMYENKLNDKKNAIANYNLYLKNSKEIEQNPKLAAFIKNKIEDLKR